MTYRSVYYNEDAQRVWRTENPGADLMGFTLCGKMTRVEFAYLLEILFANFGDENISLEQFQHFFNLVRDFSEYNKG